MFTRGSMYFIQSLICGSYPNQLRDKDERTRYFKNFERIFARYDEQDVADAVEITIEREKFLPSLATIKEILDKKLSARIEAERSSLKIAEYSKPRHKIDVQALIARLTALKEKKYEQPIPRKLRTFARSLWPDIPDSVIRKNLAILTHYASTDMQLDECGNKVQLYLSKNGEIVERVVLN